MIGLICTLKVPCHAKLTSAVMSLFIQFLFGTLLRKLLLKNKQSFIGQVIVL